MTPRILVFAGSIRTGAYSGKTADAAMKELAQQGAEVTRISLADYPLPIMDEDLEKEKGVPENAFGIGRLIAAHDGVLIASPEYNASIPPLLKNTIDWVSRVSRIDGNNVRPWSGKPVALCSSSDGNFAGIRGLYHLRAVLMNCRADIITPQCSVARAQDAFDADGNFRDDRTKGMMEATCRGLIERAKLMSTRIGA
ncbi:NAD(P)H-dependent oxidoreductase [Nitratireductor sp. GISD-1A_MAKvit]|uniref:NADPH-dependent FMN reductase n=1 Tax=Nitratireductor sp. GISD-1A_MAKvit TaxID=3234198 RepID=UPI0034676AAA